MGQKKLSAWSSPQLMQKCNRLNFQTWGSQASIIEMNYFYNADDVNQNLYKDHYPNHVSLEISLMKKRITNRQLIYLCI